nr:hypothetical protein [Bdellovibrionales bacterium]
ERTNWMKSELKRPETLIWMDTPYRLKKLLTDLGPVIADREIFLGCDLGAADELLIRGSVTSVQKGIGLKEKREFVLVVGPRK